jgi:2-methylisocitrate lyase-like PEP mutase family enzyme
MEAIKMNKAKILKDMICSGKTLVMPDAYDPLSAMLIEQMGFSAVQCSGFSIAIAVGGLAEPELSFEKNLAVTAEIVKAVGIPVMADGEDGFDDIVRTIRAYLKAGVAGINIEDQVIGGASSSACKVIDREAAAAKIRKARETAVNEGTPDLLINARTDALLSAESRAAGLKECILRCNMFFAAGADLAFVTHVASIDEVRTLVREVAGPVSIAAGLLYNINQFSIRELQDCGVARVSLPSIAIQTSIAALRKTLKIIKDTGEFAELGNAGLLCCKEELCMMKKKSPGK